jgi:hypothetical protein
MKRHFHSWHPPKGIDLKDFYLNHPLPRKEYVRIPINIIPEEFITFYDSFVNTFTTWPVYFAIGRAWPVFPQGRAANDAPRY